jgi:mono/diheme cytochrome c family protein
MRVMMVMACAVLAWFGSTGSSAAADADNGLRIAQRWCSQCHLISRDQPRASDAVPSFEAMARRGWTEGSLAAFLSNPHPKMPNMALSRAEIADLVAYITSQAAR